MTMSVTLPMVAFMVKPSEDTRYISTVNLETLPLLAVEAQIYSVHVPLPIDPAERVGV